MFIPLLTKTRIKKKKKDRKWKSISYRTYEIASIPWRVKENTQIKIYSTFITNFVSSQLLPFL